MRPRNVFRATFFMAAAYFATQNTRVKADLSCDQYMDACESLLSYYCPGTWSLGCSETSPEYNHCDCIGGWHS